MHQSPARINYGFLNVLGKPTRKICPNLQNQTLVIGLIHIPGSSATLALHPTRELRAFVHDCGYGNIRKNLAQYCESELRGKNLVLTAFLEQERAAATRGRAGEARTPVRAWLENNGQSAQTRSDLLP